MVSCGLCLGFSPSLEKGLLEGKLQQVQAFIEEDPGVVLLNFTHGCTVLHLAAKGGSVPVLELVWRHLATAWPERQALFQRRHNPFQRLSSSAQITDNQESLQQFIDAPSVLGQTAVMEACRKGQAGAVRFLLDHGANPWTRDRGNCTALHYAALNDASSCIDTILSHPTSARPPPGMPQSITRLADAGNFSGYTPLHYAVASSRLGAVQQLLTHGANVGARTWSEGCDWINAVRGSSPLHIAARRGDMPAAKLLLRHYADYLRNSGVVDPRLHTDSRSMRPFQLALERGFRGLSKMLMPWTPLNSIFGDELLSYHVPALKALAAAAFQGALLQQIDDLQAAATAAADVAQRVGSGTMLLQRDGSMVHGASGIDPSALSGALLAPSMSITARTNSLVHAASAAVGGIVSNAARRSLRSARSIRDGVGRLKSRISSSGGKRRSDTNVYGGHGFAGGGSSPGDAVLNGASGYTVPGGYSMYNQATGMYHSQYTAVTTPLSGRVQHVATASANGPVPIPIPGAGNGDAGASPGPGSVRGGSDDSAVNGHSGELMTLVADAAPGGTTMPPGGRSPLPRGSSPLRGPSPDGGSSPQRCGSPVGRTSVTLVTAPDGMVMARYHGGTRFGMPSTALGVGPPPPHALGLGVPMGSGALSDAPGGVLPGRTSIDQQQQPGLGASQRQHRKGSASFDGNGGGGSAAAPWPASHGQQGEASGAAGSAAHAPAGRPQSQRRSADGVGPDAQNGFASHRESHAASNGPARRQQQPFGGQGNGHVWSPEADDSPPRPSAGRLNLATPFAAFQLGAPTASSSGAEPLIAAPPGTCPSPVAPLAQARASGSGRMIPGSPGPKLASGAPPTLGPGPAVRPPITGTSRPHLNAWNTDVGASSSRPHPAAWGVDGANGGVSVYASGLCPVDENSNAPALGLPPGLPAPSPAHGTAGGVAVVGSTGLARGQSGDWLVLAAAASAHAGGAPPATGGSPRMGLGEPQTSGGLMPEPSAGRFGGGIGSDTSEDLCGVCFERQAMLRMLPCKHCLCSICSREVCRLNETLPPSCPFCRGVVRGFGL